uniref:Uncharacterized protein n=1 Tax=Utricularia reniformis TaxID=192314 RepID=A0A1Y0B0S3_9LAMI|nr:hypothetical protein AEK19_MT0733 [Utricularia reniformis]ART30977.1 hypothetical protein AEK19_MT0733 [Utricularia reniformis]
MAANAQQFGIRTDHAPKRLWNMLIHCGRGMWDIIRDI